MDIDWKIPDGLTKVTFLVKVETAVRSSVKSRFGVMGVSTSGTFCGLKFSLPQRNRSGELQAISFRHFH